VTHFIWQEDKLHNRRIMVFVLAIELHTWFAKTKQWVKENILITSLTFPKLEKCHSYYSTETNKSNKPDCVCCTLQ
jgi:hypothetical protein